MYSKTLTLQKLLRTIFSCVSVLLLQAYDSRVAQANPRESFIQVAVNHQGPQNEKRAEPDPSGGLERLERAIPELMERWNLPGGTIAITKDEKLLFARGYGIADKETGQRVQPDSLFRIASVSKSITAVAVLKLVEEGKLDLDAGAFLLLDNLQPPPNAKMDPRMAGITIRQLLYHSAGWDAQMSSDPMGRFREAASSLKATFPVAAETIVRYMLGRSLDFDPGTRHAYSNFGYCVLGRVIEKVAGQSYQDYVCEHLLKPVGITRMRIGHTLREQRFPGEVCYYSAASVSLVPSALSSRGGLVPLQYGGYWLESMDSHGGWIASAIDLARFLTALDGRGGRFDLLKPETIDVMTARPQPPLWVGTPIYYAMGWNVRPLKLGKVWYHTGALAGGSLAAIVCTPKGESWAVLFNSIPATLSEVNPFFVDMDRTISQAINKVAEWPAQDLFSHYR